MSVVAILLAGGSGSRVRQDVNKVYLPIRERDMLEYSLETFDRSPAIDHIVLVVREEDQRAAEALLVQAAPATPVDVVIGGPTRHQSEHRGLDAIASRIDAGSIEQVAIHDGARPFMTLDLLHTTLQAARRVGGAIPGLTIDEPVYQRSGGSARLLEASKLRKVQTPQVFDARALLGAYRAAAADGREGVDTAETVGRYAEIAVTLVPGDPRNIKVTYVEDMFEAEEYAATWSRGSWRDTPGG